MLATLCPGCGAPTPVSLASGAAAERLRCAYCTFAGPLPAATQKGLAEAAALLTSLDARQRQLTRTQRRALSGTGWKRGLLRGVLFLLVSPFVLLATCTIPSAVHDGGLRGLMLGCVFVLPPLLMIAGGRRLSRRLAGRAETLARLCAASPPRVPGEPALCRVCGAPLRPAGAEAVCRCDYCQADNLVDPVRLAAMRDRQAPVVDSFRQTVSDRARALGVDAATASLIAVAMAIGVPVGTLLIFWYLALLVSHIELAPYPKIEYALRDRGGRPCIGELMHDEIHAYLDFGPFPPPGPGRRETVAPDSLRTFPVTDLLGKHLRRKDSHVWEVLRVYGTPIGVNGMAVLAEDGTEERDSIAGACILNSEESGKAGGLPSVSPGATPKG